MEEVATVIRDWMDLGWRTAFGRVIDVQGFGGSSQVELFAMNELGNTTGGLLAGSLDDVVLPAARQVLAARRRRAVSYTHLTLPTILRV